MDVDIMADCGDCGLQSWVIKSSDDNEYRFGCSDCGYTTTVGVSDRMAAYDCHRCPSLNWTVIDQTDDHVVFECSGCGIITEFWLKNQR